MTCKRWIGSALAAVAVVIAIVLAVFQPQKLFIDETVDEPVPVAAVAEAAVSDAAVPEAGVSAQPAASAVATATPTSPMADDPTMKSTNAASAAPSAASAKPAAAAKARTGSFRSLDHEGSGNASIIDVGGKFVIRFEDLNVENGPDLHVYLSKAPGDATESAFDDDFVNLGKLKGNKGNQNYDVPAGVDVAAYNSVVVWCKRFSSGFAVAPLV